MIKELALENLFVFGSSKTKKVSSKIISKEEGGVRFIIGSFLIALNLLVLMNYIYGVNEFASSGYEIKSLQKQQTALNAENKKISIKVSESVSMVAIQNDFLNSNFVSSGTTKFLSEKQFTQR